MFDFRTLQVFFNNDEPDRKKQPRDPYTKVIRLKMPSAEEAPQPTLLVSTPNGNIKAANISVREYIYFLPYPLPPGTPIPYSTGLPDTNPLNLPAHQFEPTSTLVLTSPKNTFIDIRLFKPINPSDTPLPNKGELARLEWAFAGTSTSRALQPSDAAYSTQKSFLSGTITHSTWTHWLDSRHPVASPYIPLDEGDMYPLTDALTLEHGHAFHPHLNAHKTHEELWRDVEIASTNGADTRICVVLRLQDDGVGVRGVVVRLGQYCQGLLVRDGHVTVERWEWEGEQSEQSELGTHEGEREGKEKAASGVEEVAQWARTARVGDLCLPCTAAFRPEVLVLGGVVKYGDYKWTVEECWEWE